MKKGVAVTLGILAYFFVAYNYLYIVSADLVNIVI